MVNAVNVNNLTKIFKSKQTVKALDNVSLSIGEGEIFGMLGPNGAGKTTMIKILLGIVYPTSGTAEILGENISNYKVRKNIGYLPENHKFPNYLTGEELISYSAKLSGYDIKKASQRITDILQLVKMEKWRKTKIKKYSKGMLQRVGLAQAIVHNPKIIFLDEPTDGVDPIGRKEIRDILLNLKNEGKTIFVNSHLLSEVEMVSDKVAILNEGNLIKFGTVDELTINKHVCEIEIDREISQTLNSLLTNRFNFTYENNKLTLDIENEETINLFIDELRKNSINILSINKKKTSLEDLFINSVIK